MTTQQARIEFDAMVARMKAAGIPDNRIDDLRLTFEFAVNPEFRRTVSDMIAAANGL
jgi:hypothetical protein